MMRKRLLFVLLFFPSWVWAQASASVAPTVWPSSGKIIFDVIHSKLGMVIGQTEHWWHHDQERYTMQAVMQTAGVASFIRNFRYVQNSSGRWQQGHLIPEHFSVERNGRLREHADFDWHKTHQALMVNGDDKREVPLTQGDQDLLSLWHRVALLHQHPALELQVITGKTAAHARIERLGDELLTLPIGKVATQHLLAKDAQGALQIDFWLAPHYAYLPVRIKIQDKNGDTLDQQATRIELPHAVSTP
jgi:hypothetical protein